MYPVYVHWLKAIAPDNMLNVPYTHKSLRLRIAQLSKVIARLSALSMAEVQKLSQVRVEITVCGNGQLDVHNLTRLLLPELLLYVADNFFHFEMPLHLIVQRGSEWLDRATFFAFHDRNTVRLPDRKLQYIC
jgi:hypothetical protein